MAKKNIKTASKLKNAKRFFENGQTNEALDLYVKVTDIDPRDAEAWFMAGVICGMQGRNEDALVFLIRATQLRPEHEMSHYNLGISFRDTGNYEKAAESFKTCIQLNSKYKQAYNSLAHVLIGLKRMDEAAEVFRQLIPLEPDVAETRNNLGTVLQATGHLDEAIEQYKKAVELKPGMTSAWDGLGSAYTGSGRFDLALEAYRHSLEIDPKNARGHSNLLLTLNYMEDLEPSHIFEEHKLWGQQHGSVTRVTISDIDRNLDRRLRIGYVSPDFREHSVTYFIEPVLEAHNKDKFDIYCYSSVPRGDDVTNRLKNLVPNWRDISNQQPITIVDQIRRDKIDILVDLSGHTACNHLDVFKFKPAPIQVTWIGYPNTTGLDAMDYRITDMVTDPEEYDEFYTEVLYRLPGCFLCYKPPHHAPDVMPLPLEKNEFLTLGSFNNLSKISDGTIRLWGKLLNSMPLVHLLLKNPSLTDDKTRERYHQYLIDAGARPEQLELIGHTPSRYEHLELYNRIDIALDTFPYNGTTTTCESLWMGVPVLAMLGNRHASRVSASLLKAAGLDKFICSNEKDLVDKLHFYSKDVVVLSAIRKGMRDMLKGSELVQASTFTHQLERAYLTMWQSV